ncbi:MAG: 4-hydroxybenzoyl-CoA thioesterase [Xanthobacteraceae bacterium]|jgi:4-hydroxybenzoyl-CoA thioesterase|nr:4-hydroxybenzoyl-CoA thioesterase [Xanthobacteraceae bacterium]
MLINKRDIRIVWGDCDPAGIVFYPRYFEIFDASTTALFERALGMTKFQFLKHYDFVGYPMVDTRAKFAIPTRFGDDVVVESTISELRRSSFDIHHRLTKDGALAVEGFETRVWVGRDPVDPDKIKSLAVPPEVVAKLQG